VDPGDGHQREREPEFPHLRKREESETEGAGPRADPGNFGSRRLVPSAQAPLATEVARPPHPAPRAHHDRSKAPEGAGHGSRSELQAKVGTSPIASLGGNPTWARRPLRPLLPPPPAPQLLPILLPLLQQRPQRLGPPPSSRPGLPLCVLARPEPLSPRRPAKQPSGPQDAEAKAKRSVPGALQQRRTRETAETPPPGGRLACGSRDASGRGLRRWPGGRYRGRGAAKAGTPPPKQPPPPPLKEGFSGPRSRGTRVTVARGREAGPGAGDPPVAEGRLGSTVDFLGEGVGCGRPALLRRSSPGCLVQEPCPPSLLRPLLTCASAPVIPDSLPWPTSRGTSKMIVLSPEIMVSFQP
jgi:hypothetical protein